MTIKWVKVDPLVMNGEPFCYGTRLTVRNMLEMRSNGLTPAEMLANHPSCAASASPRRSASRPRTGRATRTSSTSRLVARPGFHRGRGRRALPEHLRDLTGVVVS